MSEPLEASAPARSRELVLPWLWGGLLLAAVQVLATAVQGPLGVSTEFVVAEGMLATALAPDYAAGHPLLSQAKYSTLDYGMWLDLGLIGGAALTSLACGRWQIRRTTEWWTANHGPQLGKRFLAGFVGGALILFGARLAGGCTSGMMASGWAQLSLSAVPFTLALFGAGMLSARLAYPRAPGEDSP